MAHILAIGIATLDIINVVERFPAEDSEMRALSQYRQRGGNATNTLVVLSQLGHQCTWGGVWVEEPDGRLILEDLAQYGIDTSACCIANHGKMPTSYITLNRHNGSRTIVHYRDLEEYPYQAFQQLNLNLFDWLHFEGRNVDDTRICLQHAREHYPQLPISVELEKPRPQLEQLLPFVDVLLCSRAYALSHGCQDARSFLELFNVVAPQAHIVCTWGEQGATAISREGVYYHAPAIPPPHVIDTVGAGDTFNAAFIDAQLKQNSLADSLNYACQLAGQKCEHMGLKLHLSR